MAVSSNRLVLFAAIATSLIVLTINFCILIRLDGLGGWMGSLDSAEARLGTLERRVDELPAKIGGEIRAINRTLSQTISTSQQKSPQIIIIRWSEEQTVP